MLLTQLPSYFKARREKLLSHPDAEGAAFIFPAAHELARNPDVTFPFRQESHFFYLTGFEETESFLVLLPAVSGSKPKTVLFVRKRDPLMEMWEGERYGIEGALKVFGADEAYLFEDFETKMPDLMKGVEKVFYRANMDEANDRKVMSVLEKLRRLAGRSGKAMLSISDPQVIIGEMRLFKSEEEIKHMREACRISALAHTAAMKEVKPGMNEFEVEALIDYVFRKNGCARVGYGSIVAGGKNAACLHYRFNNEALRDGDLLLIDAGGEYNYYTADITRTFPVGKKFSKSQAIIYDLVLKAQMECIAMAKPGTTMPAIHRKACEILTEGMLSLGLMKGDVSKLIDSGEFKRFYPHGTGHWLGMDVHDVGLYQLNGEPRKLEAGMMFTIEPGFYVQPSDEAARGEFKDIGIRIEDDILVTSQGCEVMSSGVPKKREEIEALK